MKNINGDNLFGVNKIDLHLYFSILILYVCMLYIYFKNK